MMDKANPDAAAPESTGVGKYCVVGAGPAGLSISRAFSRLGIAHDVFERHSDVGGIWDINNPGTSMYRTAHFISSKYTSHFLDYPMPQDYPDYPDNRQIHKYLQGFAHAYSLHQKITFNTEVVKSEELPNGDWMVSFNNAEPCQYKGLICCNGVTWYPAMPELDGHFSGEIIHSNQYFNSDQFRDRRVLIIGLGNSGADIACDAAQAADQAFISVRRGYHFIPKFVCGVPMDVYQHHLADLPQWMRSVDQETLMRSITGDPSRFGMPEPDHSPMDTHPLMNTELLHFLGHVDVAIKPDVQKLAGEFVEFTDGTREKIDLIVCATGYQLRIPYVPRDSFKWQGERPVLYTNTFSTSSPRLFVMGFFEVASAVYQLFDRVANLVARNILDITNNSKKVQQFEKLKCSDKTDLRGGHKYVGSDRHANYVDYTTFLEHLGWIGEEMGWPGLNPGDLALPGPYQKPDPIQKLLKIT